MPILKSELSTAVFLRDEINRIRQVKNQKVVLPIKMHNNNVSGFYVFSWLLQSMSVNNLMLK